MNFGSGGNISAKAWKDIWGCGQGIGGIKSIVPAAELIARFQAEYQRARTRLLAARAMALSHAILETLLDRPYSGYEISKRFDQTVGFFSRARKRTEEPTSELHFPLRMRNAGFGLQKT